MSTHCVSMIKNFNLSLKMKEEEAINMEKHSNGEEDHHEKLIKDQPIIKTFDIWGSILSSSKNEDSSNKLIPTSPYVHPLVKRSRSSLSEKSLEICTESLGSETGSGCDCFSSSPTSEHEDSDNEKDNHHHHQYSVVSESSEDFRVYNYSKKLLSSCRSFPPSLSSVHMQSRRQNGRLILEAAYVSPKNRLHAQRLDGHLLLTFTNRNDTKLEMENLDYEVEEFEQVFDNIQEVEGIETPHCGGSDEEEEEEDEDEGTMIEQSQRISSEMTNVNRATLRILEKKNQPIWSTCTVSFSMTSGYFDFNSRFNGPVNSMMEEEKDISNLRDCYSTNHSSVSQSLPPPRDMAEVIPTPPPAATTSLNAYEYFWRKKPTVANIVNDSTINKYYYNNKQVGVATTTVNGTNNKANSTTKIAACTQDLVLIGGNKAPMNNNFVPLLRSCKEPRRSLIIWEPYCIATS